MGFPATPTELSLGDSFSTSGDCCCCVNGGGGDEILGDLRGS